MARTRSEGLPPGLNTDRPEVQALKALLKKPELTLEDYFQVGEQMRLLTEDTTVARHGSGWRERVAELAETSAPTLNKALQFRLAYEAGDLAELHELKVGWSMLTIALAVTGRKQRHALLRRAREEGWDGRQLQREIQQRRGRVRGGGRPRKEARRQGLVADLAELTRLTELWNDFQQGVWASGADGYAAEARKLKSAARESVAAMLDEAGEKLRLLLKGAEDARKVVAALRKGLPAR